MVLQRQIFQTLFANSFPEIITKWVLQAGHLCRTDFMKTGKVVFCQLIGCKNYNECHCPGFCSRAFLYIVPNVIMERPYDSHTTFFPWEHFSLVITSNVIYKNTMSSGHNYYCLDERNYASKMTEFEYYLGATNWSVRQTKASPIENMLLRFVNTAE